ncbi:MAG: hypothetical protein H7239_14330 [Flavobacterium sp.]|nr:hypothetical protein [Flavobacterium sp.]
MEIGIINGKFSKSETLDLISQMIAIKIKFLEGKMCNSNNEEDIKNKESKIIALQNKLSDLRNNLDFETLDLDINCVIKIN